MCTLATIMIIVVCLVAGERTWMLEAQRESQIATKLERLGGRIFYCWRFDERITFQSSSNKPPQWFMPGDTVIARVDLKSCLDRELDRTVACLRSLRNLRGLELAGTSITNAGLQSISGISSLELLDLSSTNISDEGIRHLRACQSLTWLYLPKTSLTDACVPDLAALKQLKWICLRDTRITPSGIAQLHEQCPALCIVSDHDSNSWSRPFHDSHCGSSDNRSLTGNRFVRCAMLNRLSTVRRLPPAPIDCTPSTKVAIRRPGILSHRQTRPYYGGQRHGVVERTFGWLGRFRCFTRGYERLAKTLECWP